MYQSVTFSDFVDEFEFNNRQDQFSYEGKRALFAYLENLEDDIGEPIELDVIGLCCDYVEYDSAQECALEYGWERDEDHDDEEATDEALDFLRDQTTVIEFDGGVIIQQF